MQMARVACLVVAAANRVNDINNAALELGLQVKNLPTQLH